MIHGWSRFLQSFPITNSDMYQYPRIDDPGSMIRQNNKICILRLFFYTRFFFFFLTLSASAQEKKVQSGHFFFFFVFFLYPNMALVRFNNKSLAPPLTIDLGQIQ